MKKLAPLIHDTENGLDYILVGEIDLFTVNCSTRRDT